MTLLELPRSLQWKRPSVWARVTTCGSVQIPRAPRTYTYPSTLALWRGLKIVLALSSGLIKLSHSCWTFPEENHRQVGGKGCSSKPSVTAYYGFFILLRGLFGDFGTATAVLQGQGKHRGKQYMLYPGTRKKISLHFINGSHTLWDDYTASVLPRFHANMLSMLTKKAPPFRLLLSIWPSGFLNGHIEITVVQMWLLIRSDCHCL